MSKILTKKSAALALALATLGSAALVTGAEARPATIGAMVRRLLLAVSCWARSSPPRRPAARRSMSMKKRLRAAATRWNA